MPILKCSRRTIHVLDIGFINSLYTVYSIQVWSENVADGISNTTVTYVLCTVLFYFNLGLLGSDRMQNIAYASV